MHTMLRSRGLLQGSCYLWFVLGQEVLNLPPALACALPELPIAANFALPVKECQPATRPCQRHSRL